MQDKVEVNTWAFNEFGRADLGDERRTNRLVSTFSDMCEAPDGRVTQMFSDPAKRKGAYRILENSAVKIDALNQASTQAAVHRAQAYNHVYIPVDGTSLRLASSPAKDLGNLNSYEYPAKGVHVHNSIIVSPDGRTLGIGHQEYYARIVPEIKRTRDERHRLPIEEKETHYWLICTQQTEAAFEKAGGSVECRFVFDQAGDFYEMLEYAATARSKFIIRSNWDRVLESNSHEKSKRHLVEELDRAPLLGAYQFELSAQPDRTARTAIMHVSARHCAIRLENQYIPKHATANMWVIHVRETGPVPAGEEPIEWRLLTNCTVETFEQAAEVVYGYTFRWRIEEMHRCWKTVCNVEMTRLRSFQTLVKFAILMASVAARIQHIKATYHERPTDPADSLFSAAELKAIQLLRFHIKEDMSEDVTIKQAIIWLAQVGGYIGPSNGPPGQETIGRGLMRIQIAVEVLLAMGWIHEIPPF